MRKWSPSSRAFAAAGVVLGLCAFLLMRGFAQHAGALRGELGRPVRVVVAARDLPRGAVLDPSMLSVATWPSTYAPTGAVRSTAAVTGRVLLAGLSGGEVLTWARLAPRGGAVAALIPPGLLVVQVPSSLAPGSVAPGDRVDVLATFPGAHAHTESVASGLEVLRVVTAAAVPGAEGGNETELLLLVAPDQARELAYARAFAAVSVALDGPEEVIASG